jgi:hypothetical protein
MQHELILLDELDNSYKCKYISSDNIDKCAICIIELLHLTNNILTYGSKLYHYDIQNDIYCLYLINNIYSINSISITCKLYFVGSEYLEKQLFAYMLPDAMNNRSPIWFINSNLILNPIYDYELCKIFNETNDFLYVIVQKNCIVQNTYIIRRPNNKELTLFKNQAHFSVINIIPNNFSESHLGNKLFKNWCKLLNFNKNLINIENKISQTQEEDTSSKKFIQEDTFQEDILQKDTSQEDIIQDNTSQEDIILDNTSQEDIIQENRTFKDISQKDTSNEENLQKNKTFKDILLKYTSNEDVLEEDKIQDDDSIKTLDENNEEDNLENHIIQKNIINISTTSSLTDKEDLSDESIEKDTFYDNVIELDNKLDNSFDNCIFTGNIKKMPYNNNLLNKNSNKKKNKQVNKITVNAVNITNKECLEDTSNNDIIEVLSKFDIFYQNHIIKDIVKKEEIYERYTAIVFNYDNDFLNQKVEVILDDILNVFKKNMPSLVIDEKIIHDKVCSDMIKMADKLKDNMDEKFLLPFIKPFKLIFGNIFNDLDPIKRKMILIMYSLSDKSDLTSFLGMVPTLLFQDNMGIIKNGCYFKEDKVTIFHMEYMYNIFEDYVLKLLFKYKKNVLEINLGFKDSLIKLLYQYFSCYIVHTDLTAIILVKNTIYDHCIELIQYHLQFLYPTFELGIDFNYDRLKTVKESYNRYMLKYRILTSSLLRTLDDDNYYIMAGFMSKLLNSYFYCPNTGKIVNYINDEDVKLHLNFEDYVKKEFLKATNNLKRINSL